MGRPKIYADGAQRNRELAAIKSRQKSLSVREIGPLPPIENPDRKAKCKENLQLFLEEYFPDLFRAEWSTAHLQLIADLENAIRYGQSSVCILPRGFGKSTIALCSAIWAALYGYKKYIVLIAASASAGKKLTTNIKYELMYNSRLGPVVMPDTPADEYPTQGDFPEVVLPLRKVGTQTARASGQLLDGRQTNAKMSADRLILPAVEDSVAAGAVIESSGLGAGIRGRNISTCAGSLRPDFLICDDLQTDKSAQSATRVTEQLSLLNGCLKGLSSIDKPITSVVTATILQPDDLAVQLLKAPNWRSTKFGVIDKLPSDTSMELWAKYNQVQNDAISEGLDDSVVAERCNAFFDEHKDELIDNCNITWDSFKDPLDVHPMQKVMRLYFSDVGTFCREYQNEPELISSKTSEQLTVEQLNSKISEYPKGKLPIETEALTLGCDSQTLGLFWTLMAHYADGSAHIVDFGKYPKGKRTLTSLYDSIPLEQAIYQGYTDLAKDLLNRIYTRPDGLEMKIGKALIDASHGPTSEAINRFIRDANNPIISPLYGRAKTPDELVFGKKKPGELRGKGWSMPPVRAVRGTDGKKIILPRSVLVDVNAWKSALRSGLQARLGAPGSISIFKDAPANLKEFFLHLTSERSSPVTGRYGTIDMFKLIPNRQNHWLDTTNYAYCAGSMVQKVGGTTMKPSIEAQFIRKRVKLSDIQKQKGY